jgi:hypothetical protein
MLLIVAAAVESNMAEHRFHGLLTSKNVHETIAKLLLEKNAEMQFWPDAASVLPRLVTTR